MGSRAAAAAAAAAATAVVTAATTAAGAGGYGQIIGDFIEFVSDMFLRV